MINYSVGGGGWLQNEKIAGPKLFVPSLSRHFFLVPHTLSKGGNILCLPSVRLELQAPMLNYLKTLCVPLQHG